MRARLTVRGLGLGAGLFTVVHLVHIAGVTAAPVVVGAAVHFLCHIP